MPPSCLSGGTRQSITSGCEWGRDRIGLGIEEDLALLRAFEPVAKFTEGEWFYPVSVQHYVDCLLYT